MSDQWTQRGIVINADLQFGFFVKQQDASLEVVHLSEHHRMIVVNIVLPLPTKKRHSQKQRRTLADTPGEEGELLEEVQSLHQPAPSRRPPQRG